MNRTMLKSKIHRATVTHCNLNYEGSCAIDKLLLEAADIHEFEQIDIYNINNGERFSTYALIAPAGSGIIALNGAAARKAALGDLLIIASYATFDEQELAAYAPRLVYVNEHNHRLKEERKIPLERVLP